MKFTKKQFLILWHAVADIRWNDYGVEAKKGINWNLDVYREAVRLRASIAMEGILGSKALFVPKELQMPKPKKAKGKKR